MPQYVAFLRAINVGGHTVRMDRLKALFEQLGLANVSTFIASGNVIFESPLKNAAALEEKIDAQLRAALGYEVGTFIRTAGELQAIAAAQQASPDGTETLYVCFLPDHSDAAAAAQVEALSTPDDQLRLRGRELYWLRRGRISDTEVKGPQLARALGMPSTMRNMNTVRRILAKLA